MDNNLPPMPTYKCHKTVRAFKIVRVSHLDESDTSAIRMEFDGVGRIAVVRDHEFAARHKPHAGCYFVVYEDGYESISPSEAFENGYTRIP